MQDWDGSTNDSFNAGSNPGVINDMSPVDYVVMSALGYNLNALDLAGSNTSVGSLSGAQIVFNSGGANAKLTVGSDNTSTTFTGNIWDGSLWNGSTSTTGLTKIGSGTLKLTGDNTYSGQTTLIEGVIKAGSITAFSPNSAFVLKAGTTLDLGGRDNTIGSLAGDAGSTVTNSFSVDAILTTGNDGTSTAFFGNIVDGPTSSVGLTKIGSGTLKLAGDNTYSGQTTLIAGEIKAGSTRAFSLNSAFVLSAGTTLDLRGQDNTIGSLAGDAGSTVTNTLGPNATLTTGNDGTRTAFSGNIVDGPADTIGLTKIGSGTLKLAGDNTYSGQTTLSMGGIVAGSTSAFSPNSAFVLKAGTTLDLRGQNNTVGSLAGDAGSTVTNTLGHNATLTTGNNGTSTAFSGNIVDGSADTIGLTKVGSDRLYLVGNNTYSGQTTLSMGGIVAGSTSAFSPNSAFVLSAGANLELDGNSNTIGSLSGPGGTVTNTYSPTSVILTTGNDNTSTTFGGIIKYDLGLTKVGIGTFTLTGSNSYTGATTIKAGNLAVDNNGTTTYGTLGSGAVTVDGGTIYLGNGGYLEFVNGASAGSGEFTTEGGTVNGAGCGYTVFKDHSTAGSATFTNNGAVIAPNSGGITAFENSSNAGSATLIANKGSNGGSGGGIFFEQFSDGGTARVIANGDRNNLGSNNGYLDISGLTKMGISIGSIEGGGNFYLGNKTLTVGGNNRSALVSGVIQDGGGFGDPPGGSFIKTGTGTLTLSGVNSYTGSTTVSSGALTVNGSIASSSGVSVSLGATLAGAGSVSNISGSGTVAPGGSQILTATQVDPGSGLGFDFVFSQLGAPTWSNASASGNDLLHLTNATPLVSALTSANTINVDFSAISGSLASGQIYYGGLFLNTAATLGSPTFAFTGTGGKAVHYLNLANVSSADFGTGTVTNGKVMEFTVTNPLIPTSTTTTVSGGENYSLIIAPVTATGGYGSTATIAGGSATSTSDVTVAFTGTGNFGSAASDVATVSGMPDKGAGPLGSTLTDQFVLKLSYDVTAATALGGASTMELLWQSPATAQWVNAILGNSDSGAGANFVTGAYDANNDFHLSWFGVDIADGYVWAVLDHNSTFVDGNPSDAPFGAVPEPSTWTLLMVGVGALLAFRRRPLCRPPVRSCRST